MSDDKAPAIGFSLEIQVGPVVRMVFQTFSPQEDGLTGLNKVVDMCHAAAERKALQAEIDNPANGFVAQLATAEQKVLEAQDAFDRITNEHQTAWQESAKRGPVKLAGNQAAEKRNAQATIDGLKVRIAWLKTQIEDGRARLATMG